MSRRRKAISRKELKTLTLGELKKLRPSSYLQTIRRDARLTLREQNDPEACLVCTYNIITHCSHVVDIKEWEDWATIGEINDPDNLIWLCPNCHAEYDLGYMDIYAYCPDCSITNKHNGN